jgi:hypothetical protein
VKTGIHFGMSMQEYLAIPAVSNGVLRTLLERCPAAAWHCSPFNPRRTVDYSDASDAGTIAHSILLEGSRDCLEVIDPNDHPAEKTGAIPSGWTNKSIKAARDAARADGKIPVLPSDVAEIDALVCAAQSFVDSLRATEPAIHAMMQPDGGKSEVVMVWEEGGTLCKLRADRISADNQIVLDYKTTALSAEPQAWARTMLDYMGAAWYRRGVRAVTGVDPDYVFLIGERAAPFLHSIVGITPADLALGDDKIGYAMREWQKCEAAGHFPGYTNRVAYCDAPVWHRLKWDERNGLDEQGTPVDAELWAQVKERSAA